MANEQNLRPKPWKPGQSGNPAGYSRNRRLSDALSRLIDEKGADGALATVWLRKALEGNPVFFGMLLDRIEGKVPSTLNVHETDGLDDTDRTELDAIYPDGEVPDGGPGSELPEVAGGELPEGAGLPAAEATDGVGGGA